MNNISVVDDPKRGDEAAAAAAAAQRVGADAAAAPRDEAARARMDAIDNNATRTVR
jgi:hypothetical protein